jgi:excisionase family DNA binding protein
MARTLLTLKQAAMQLKVTGSVIREMINSKLLQTVKSGNTIKIDKSELDEWLASLNEEEVKKLSLQRSICRFNDYYKPEYIHLDFEADNKYEAIAEMSKRAKELGIVRDHRWLYQVVVAREELVSTAVGNGVTLLHARHFHPSKIKKPSVIFGRSKDEIEFDAIDNKPVRLYFMLLLHNDYQHLFSISYISKNIILSEENLKILLEADSPEDIASVIVGNVIK